MADYVRQPHYPLPGPNRVRVGWETVAATVPTGVRRIGVDGPATMAGGALADGALADGALADRVAAALAGATGRPVEVVSTFSLTRPWPEIVALTGTAELSEDPDFARLAGGTIGDLLDPDRLASLAASDPGAGLLVVIGPGAALSGPDLLWWADRPKRYAEAEVTAGRGRNLFQPATETATTKRLFYLDWPLLDRHRDAVSEQIEAWVDLREPEQPTWIDGPTLRAGCANLARQPFRTLPTFNTTPWGGQWGRRKLGFNPDRANTALGYELIAPESGVLVGDEPGLSVEIPFQLIVARHPVEMMGQHVHEQFGTSFPIRFDYLDTVDGGNLSVHTHPQPAFMRDVFGWPYTQHESYYLMVGGPDNLVYLGLRENADLEEFHRQAAAAHELGRRFDITRFVQIFPAQEHQLFLIPAGTPHGSGAGNVVLEVSATPYLYSLRFFDWLRTDAQGRQRPVHVEHAFTNLDPDRQGPAVSDQLIQQPRPVGGGDGWQEEILGRLPEMFFEVSRVSVEAGASADQADDHRFHVLTLVEGDRCRIETSTGYGHDLHFAETIAVPASVGAYQIRATASRPVRLVKAKVT